MLALVYSCLRLIIFRRLDTEANRGLNNSANSLLFCKGKEFVVWTCWEQTSISLRNGKETEERATYSSIESEYFGECHRKHHVPDVYLSLD